MASEATESGGIRNWLATRRIRLQITIFASFCLLTILLVTAIISYTYWANGRAASRLAVQLLDQTSNTVIERTNLLVAPLFSLAEAVPLLPNVGVAPTLAVHPATAFLLDAVDQYEQVSSAYLGYESGDFFQVVGLHNMPVAMAASYAAPGAARFALRRIITSTTGARIELWQFLDRHRRLVGSRARADPDYDPRQRPWYREAAVTYLTRVVDPYLFASGDNEYGITVSKRFGGQVSGVFGVDLALSNMSRFLAEQRNLHGGHLNAFVLSAAGEVIAAPETGQIMGAAGDSEQGNRVLEWVRDALSGAGQLNTERPLFRRGGIDYLYHFERLPEQQIRDATLAIIVPESLFTAPIDRARNLTIMLSVLALLLSLPAIVWVARKVSHPLELLMEQAHSIRNLEFAAESTVKSRIVEIAKLVEAFKAMRVSLTIFGKYVPRDLVRSIVASGINPEIGGARTPIATLFTDIRDFTHISEELGAERTLAQLSVYLGGMVEIIQAHKGTVDKYIGDAIMAYWNAPRIDPHYATNACIATLQCRAWLANRNRQWHEKGDTRLETRFGLHAGEAIVGNMGSQDRMDYTALGSTVNEGSRLEGLNKLYGTEIIASQVIADLASPRLVFRDLGRVRPKGVHDPIAILELIGVDPARALDGEAGICCSEPQLEVCQLWSEIMGMFVARRWDDTIAAIEALPAPYNSDGVARYFTSQCRHFSHHPPEPDWEGIRLMESK